MSPVRRAALNALLTVDAGRLTLPAAVERERTALSDPRDQSLLLQLVAGTLRWRNALDAVIVARSRRDVGDIHPTTRAILRVSVFQMRYLDRVPAHAVVHDAVDLARAAGQPRAAGFVNAVLRAVQRERTSTLPARPSPDAPRADHARYLTVTLSHPAWLVERWLDRYGFEAAEAWCRYNNEPPGLVVRIPRGASPELAAAIDRPGSGVTRSKVLDDVVLVDGGRSDGLLDADRTRLAYQDEASQLIAHATPVPSTGLVLDVCASPGNKTRLVAERCGPGVRVVAADYRPGRVARLKATLEGEGLAIPIVRLDARRPLPFDAAFETVLIDAPCSGLGTLRREPDLKWSRTEADLPGLVLAQGAMMRSAATAVKPGGRLVYATCSSEPDENERVVRQFLDQAPDFTAEPVHLGAPVRPPMPFLEPDGCLRTRPDRDGLDAFFAAVLVRRGAA